MSEVGPIVVLLVGFFCSGIAVLPISVSPHVCFTIELILISMFLRQFSIELGIFANRTTECLRNQGRAKDKDWTSAS